jgi:hypothetical protein
MTDIDRDRVPLKIRKQSPATTAEGHDIELTTSYSGVTGPYLKTHHMEDSPVASRITMSTRSVSTGATVHATRMRGGFSGMHNKNYTENGGVS